MPDDDPKWDARMMARVRAGDDSALAAIYDRYSAMVFGIAARTMDRNHAADITQHVFLKLWELPDAFDEARGSLRAYLAVVARRRAIDAGRRRQRSARRDELDARTTPTAGHDVEHSVIAGINSERLRAAVHTLPDDQRRAIELAYFEGLTFREVAVATGVPEGTAKSRLRLALNRLATHLYDMAEAYA